MVYKVVFTVRVSRAKSMLFQVLSGQKWCAEEVVVEEVEGKDETLVFRKTPPLREIWEKHSVDGYSRLRRDPPTQN